MVGIPLWHRLGPLAAPLAFLVASYTSIFVICSMLGTDCGMQVQYLAIAAGAVLVVGTDRPIFLAVTGSVAVALFIALECLVPADTGLLTKTQMLENFAGCIVETSLILFAIVFYAVRQTARAEEVAEREYTRSETLLRNILPEAITTRLKSSTEIIADRYDNASVLFADMAGFTNGPVRRRRFRWYSCSTVCSRRSTSSSRSTGWKRSRRLATATWLSVAFPSKRGPCAGFGTLCSRHAPGHRDPPRPARRCGTDPDRHIERPAGGGRRGQAQVLL